MPDKDATGADSPPTLFLYSDARKLIADLDASRREVERLRDACRDLLSAMDMQEKRESGEFHITGETALCIWRDAQAKANAALSAQGQQEPTGDSSGG